MLLLRNLRRSSARMSLPEGAAMSSRAALFVVILAVMFAGQRTIFPSETSHEHLDVIDGDTLPIDGHVVQLYGIDAPELGQLCESGSSLWHCGTEAALALRKLVMLNRSTLRCSPWHADGAAAAETTPGTSLEVCQIGDQDLALLMLNNGQGLALPGSFPDYTEAEQRARAAGLGIWHSDFVAPWEWRAGVDAPNRRSDALRECNVKGSFGADGQRVYYVPTDAEYQAITIDPQAGETVFCSDDEARQAGWRRIGERASVHGKRPRMVTGSAVGARS